MQVKMRGVYDLNLFNYLKRVGVKQFGFDLRPASFNFTPMRTIIEMLESSAQAEDKYFFMFGNEKDFVIEQLVNHVRKKSNLKEENICLEFTDATDLSKLSTFGIPFLWRFRTDVDFRKMTNSPLLKGISVSHADLISWRDSGELYNYIKELGDLMRPDQWIDLRLDWGDNISESLLDFLKIETYSYEIDAQVEDSYRKINMGLVSSHLDHAKRILNLDC